jgi:bacterioferritin (cytochrome b1)
MPRRSKSVPQEVGHSKKKSRPLNRRSVSAANDQPAIFFQPRSMFSPNPRKFNSRPCQSSVTTSQFTSGGCPPAAEGGKPFGARPLAESYAKVPATVSKTPRIIPNRIGIAILQRQVCNGSTRGGGMGDDRALAKVSTTRRPTWFRTPKKIAQGGRTSRRQSETSRVAYSLLATIYAAQLEIHAKQELDHALILARQIDYLGKMPVVTPKPVRTSKNAEDMLRYDLDNENETILNYRDRIRQCEALGEYAMAEQIRQILMQEQDHQIDLATALGIEVPDVSGGPKGRSLPKRR